MIRPILTLSLKDWAKIALTFPEGYVIIKMFPIRGHYQRERDSGTWLSSLA